VVLSAGKTFRRDHQRDDHWRAIGPVIAAVTVAARILRIVRRGRLETGAGQIVEQHWRVRAERLAPCGALRIIDLAEVEHLTLHDAAIVEAFIFDHTPAGVLLAVLLTDLGTQKHIGRRAYTCCGGPKEGGSSLQAILRREGTHSLGNLRAAPSKKTKTKVESAKSG
jgi:hypothetical protein